MIKEQQVYGYKNSSRRHRLHLFVEKNSVVKSWA